MLMDVLLQISMLEEAVRGGKRAGLPNTDPTQTLGTLVYFRRGKEVAKWGLHQGITNSVTGGEGVE